MDLQDASKTYVDIERNRILGRIEHLECADQIMTSQGLEEGWTPRMVALLKIFKDIVNNENQEE